MTAFGRPANAETLEEALADAYLINPVLNAERARLRATDEEVAVAKSGLRPFIFGTADTAFQNTNTKIGGGGGSTGTSDVGLLTRALSTRPFPTTHLPTTTREQFPLPMHSVRARPARMTG